MKPRARQVLMVAGGAALLVAAYYVGRESAPTAEPATSKVSETKEEGSAPREIKFTPEALKLAGIELATAAAGPTGGNLSLTGQVRENPQGTANVTARVAGRVVSVPVNVGETVRQGQVLATLSSPELAQAQASYAQALARVQIATSTYRRQLKLAKTGAFGQPSLDEARSNLAQAQSDQIAAEADAKSAVADVADAEAQVATAGANREQSAAARATAAKRLERAQALLKEEILSRQDFEQAQLDLRRAEADLAVADAGVKQAQARVGVARSKQRLAEEKTAAAKRKLGTAMAQARRAGEIFRGGYLTNKEVLDAQGALVQARAELEGAARAVSLYGGVPGGGSDLAVSAPIGGRIAERSVTLGESVGTDKVLFSILNPSAVWVELDAFQRDLPSIRHGALVDVTTDAAPGTVFKGRVTEVSASLDPEARTARVRVAVSTGSALKPRTFVTGLVRGVASDGASGIMVPAEAVQDLGGEKVVFTPSGTGSFKARPVETGPVLNALVPILAGLSPGERYVAKGAFTVKGQAMKSELGEAGE